MIKIGIIGAMELEVETLKNKMQISEIIQKASMEFFDGYINGTPVIVVKSGVGKVNAGICTQILADLFSVTHIINTGVAGSLNAEINIGDIVVSTDACYHDVDATLFGYQPGEVPQLGRLTFEADPVLIAAASKASKEVNSDIQVYSGRVVSGDQFICDQSRKDTIRSTFHADCTEMEGTSIAQAAFLNHIPFVIIRAISDKADHSAEMDYPAFEKAAALHSAKLVENMIGKL